MLLSVCLSVCLSPTSLQHRYINISWHSVCGRYVGSVAPSIVTQCNMQQSIARNEALFSRTIGVIHLHQGFRILSASVTDICIVNEFKTPQHDLSSASDCTTTQRLHCVSSTGCRSLIVCSTNSALWCTRASAVRHQSTFGNSSNLLVNWTAALTCAPLTTATFSNCALGQNSRNEHSVFPA